MGDYLIPVSSPLDTLARKTSSRRRPPDIQLPLPHDEHALYPDPPILDAPPPRRPLGNPPQSPLLHTRFRASVATEASHSTSAELYGYIHQRTASGTQDVHDDDVSIYSTATSSFPGGRLSNVPPIEPEPVDDLRGRVQGRVQSTSALQSSGTCSLMDGRRFKNRMIDPNSTHQRRSPSRNAVPLPTVVVSEEPEDSADAYDPGWGNAPPSAIDDSGFMVGRTPSSLPLHLNFSRPVRPAGTAEESKRLVLARNAFRRSAASNSNPRQSPQPQPRASPHLLAPLQTGPSAPKAPLTASPDSFTPPTMPYSVPIINQPIPLLHDPPPPPSARSSLYSAYSYYQLDSPSDLPPSDRLQVPSSPQAPPLRTQSPLATTPALRNDAPQPDLADQLLQEGIRHHEEDRLKEAAIAFERSANTPGGSGVGMLMWGLSLRHGWGCPKNESLGFSWLRRAAEAAVGDLERARAGHDVNAVRGELVLAIYEVGQCFFHGWGVKKDQKMAVVSLPCSLVYGRCRRGP
jgi:hypothetical protein